MPPATRKSVTLTDAELVRKAWRLIRNTGIKDSLPPRHTIGDLIAACLKFEEVLDKFIAKYGKRLEQLDSVAFQELSTNRTFTSINPIEDHDDNPS